MVWGLFLFSSFLAGRIQGLVWIVGHSYVCWGARRGDACPDGRQLGFSRQDACIRWLGVPGMLWGRAVSEVQICMPGQASGCVGTTRGGQ